jgi:hypothetical protein
MASYFVDIDPRELRTRASRPQADTYASDSRRFAPMISQTQREALAVLGELCELSPDVRLGQLMAQLGFLREDQTGRTLWDLDDEQFLEVRHRCEQVARTKNLDELPTFG